MIETVPEKVTDRSSADFSKFYTPEEWESLIGELNELPHFKLSVKSAPGDDYKRVYTLVSGQEGDLYDYNNKITFVFTDMGVHVEKQYHRSDVLEVAFKCLFEEPLKRLPLYINDKRPIIKSITMWRLRNRI